MTQDKDHKDQRIGQAGPAEAEAANDLNQRIDEALKSWSAKYAGKIREVDIAANVLAFWVAGIVAGGTAEQEELQRAKIHVIQYVEGFLERLRTRGHA